MVALRATQHKTPTVTKIPQIETCYEKSIVAPWDGYRGNAAFESRREGRF